jgi:hypothetical protein
MIDALTAANRGKVDKISGPLHNHGRYAGYAFECPPMGIEQTKSTNNTQLFFPICRFEFSSSTKEFTCSVA